MINRGKLMRDIEKGKVEARLGFHIDRDDYRYDRYGNEKDKFVPAKVIDNNEQFEEGKMNIRRYSFKSKSGHAYKKDNGEISFGSHSNEDIILRYKQ